MSTPTATRRPNRLVNEMRDEEFDRMRTLIHEQAGISLHDSKRALLDRRLTGRIRELGLLRMDDYYDVLLGDRTGAEMVHMLDLVTTNETHFFREPRHFELLEQTVIPAWRAAAAAGQREKRIRVWSAACSTGQEPYSIAMLLLSQLPASEGWSIDVLGTDLGTHVLRTAQEATWKIEKAAEIPPVFLKRFMLRGVDSLVGYMRASDELRAVVRFGRVNLNDAHYPVDGSFDLIFCRNVLIYFSPESRGTVIERLTQRLTPEGLLFVGHAESIQGQRGTLRSVMPTVYTRVA